MLAFSGCTVLTICLSSSENESIIAECRWRLCWYQVSWWSWCSSYSMQAVRFRYLRCLLSFRDPNAVFCLIIWPTGS